MGNSAAAVTVLANHFGANISFVVETDSTDPALFGVKRSFPDFPSALDELVAARIYGGVHYRFADADARQLGTAIANYIIGNAFQSFDGRRSARQK